MKLKTLKDLNSGTIAVSQDGSEFVNIGDLKAEAIKWVKEDIKKFGKSLSSAANWRWMHFFNITEEDLK